MRIKILHIMRSLVLNVLLLFTLLSSAQDKSEAFSFRIGGGITFPLDDLSKPSETSGVYHGYVGKGGAIMAKIDVPLHRYLSFYTSYLISFNGVSPVLESKIKEKYGFTSNALSTIYGNESEVYSVGLSPKFPLSSKVDVKMNMSIGYGVFGGVTSAYITDFSDSNKELYDYQLLRLKSNTIQNMTFGIGGEVNYKISNRFGVYVTADYYSMKKEDVVVSLETQQVQQRTVFNKTVNQSVLEEEFVLIEDVKVSLLSINTGLIIYFH